MNPVLGPMYWCHQCNRQTRSNAGREPACCMRCRGRLVVEAMENTEADPGQPSSPTPFSGSRDPGWPGTSREVVQEERADRWQMLRTVPDRDSEVLQALAEREGARAHPGQYAEKRETRRADQGCRPGLISGIPQALAQEEHGEDHPDQPDSPSHPDNVLELPSQVSRELVVGRGSRHAIRREEPERQDDRYPEIPPGLEVIPDLTQLVQDQTHRECRDQERQYQLRVPERDMPLATRPCNLLPIFDGDVPNLSRGMGNIGSLVNAASGAEPQLLPRHFRDVVLAPWTGRWIRLVQENIARSRCRKSPACRTAVECMPTIRITEEQVGAEAIKCAICKDDLEIGDGAKQMPCNHMYHENCILPWLAANNSCPLCRYQMPTEEPDHINRRCHSALHLSAGPSRSATDEHEMVSSQSVDMGTSRTEGRSRRIARHAALVGVPRSEFHLSSNTSGADHSSPRIEGLTVERGSTTYGEETERDWSELHLSSDTSGAHNCSATVDRVTAEGDSATYCQDIERDWREFQLGSNSSGVDGSSFSAGVDRVTAEGDSTTYGQDSERDWSKFHLSSNTSGVDDSSPSASRVTADRDSTSSDQVSE